MLAAVLMPLAALGYWPFGSSGASSSPIFEGVAVIEEGVIEFNGQSPRKGSDFLQYTVKVPSPNYPKYITRRTFYARQAICNQEHLTKGVRVRLTTYKLDNLKWVRRAVTEKGCVIQDEQLLRDMRRAHRNYNRAFGISCWLISASFVVVGTIKCIRRRGR